MTRTKERGTPDYTLFFSVLGLMVFGIVMVFSASFVRSVECYGHPYYYLVTQLIWTGLGLSVMMFLMHFDVWRYRKLAPYLMGLAFLLLILVLIPGIGQVRNDARRWLGVGQLAFQPAEIARVAILFFLADSLARRWEDLQNPVKGLGPYLALIGLCALLILMEPDLGTAVTVAGAAIIVIFVAGANPLHLFGVGVLSVPALIWALKSEPYRWQRLMAFRDPWKDPGGSGYQIIQALYALGSGGPFGAGIGYSRQKWFYLPESDTDFIFAILGEELGFMGAAFVVGLFCVVACRGFRAAMAAPDRFSCLLAVGLTSLVTLQAITNVGVVTGCLPITGIPLPFISRGGSSLVVNFLAMGIVLNISRYAQR